MQVPTPHRRVGTWFSFLAARSTVLGARRSKRNGVPATCGSDALPPPCVTTISSETEIKMSNATPPRGTETLPRAWESVAAPPRDPERRKQLHALVQRLLGRSEDDALEGVLLGYLLGVDERWREPASARHEAPPEAQHLDDEDAVATLYEGIDVIADLDHRVSPRAARRLRYLVYGANPNRAEIWRWVEEERPGLAAITKPANAQHVVKGILLAVQEGARIVRV